MSKLLTDEELNGLLNSARQAGAHMLVAAFEELIAVRKSARAQAQWAYDLRTQLNALAARSEGIFNAPVGGAEHR